MRRSFRRSRFRAKSHWIWADAGLITLPDTGTTVGTRAYAAELILPPGRTKWLCDNNKRSSLTVTGVLLWLDFHWQTDNPDTVLPDTDFWVDTTQEDDQGNIAFVRDPYFEPQVPSAMAAWTDAASDGLDGFMWSHRIYGGTPPNVSYTSRDAGFKGNQAFSVPGASSDQLGWVCRAFSVRAEWQPDVHIKTKRRLRSDEGLILGLSAPAAQVIGTGQHCILKWNVRIVGR